mmetsp:Transcript_21486/g.50088  ORF Transcript_21486/g.50088 Transcript_21486/m.50088 type:complete len:201 (-) Transcript_21486:2203-2805(-)
MHVLHRSLMSNPPVLCHHRAYLDLVVENTDLLMQALVLLCHSPQIIQHICSFSQALLRFCLHVPHALAQAVRFFGCVCYCRGGGLKVAFVLFHRSLEVFSSLLGGGLNLLLVCQLTLQHLDVGALTGSKMLQVSTACICFSNCLPQRLYLCTRGFVLLHPLCCIGLCSHKFAFASVQLNASLSDGSRQLCAVCFQRSHLL